MPTLLPLLLLSTPFKTLAPGIDYAVRRGIHVVRIDPTTARLEARSVELERGGNRTAGRWCDDLGAVVTINAGMYAMDHEKHVGFFKVDGEVLTDRWAKYESVLLMKPAMAHIGPKGIDPDEYPTVVQNLRLIKRPRTNVWKPSRKKWSEAAIAQDRSGRILFLFSRRPYSMYRFNQKLMAMNLGVVAAQHAEGGPEASLSIRARGLSLDLAGSYETGFNENEDNVAQWRIPNVLVAFGGPE